jgi:hypothetical protein
MSYDRSPPIPTFPRQGGRGVVLATGALRLILVFMPITGGRKKAG